MRKNLKALGIVLFLPVGFLLAVIFPWFNFGGMLLVFLIAGLGYALFVEVRDSL